MSLTLNIVTGPARKFCRAWGNKRLNSAQKREELQRKLRNFTRTHVFKHVLMISMIRATDITGTTHRLKAKLLFKYLTI